MEPFGHFRLDSKTLIRFYMSYSPLMRVIGPNLVQRLLQMTYILFNISTKLLKLAFNTNQSIKYLQSIILVFAISDALVLRFHYVLKSINSCKI